MAAAVAQFYFRFRTGCRHFLQKVNVYQHTKYRQDNLIYRRDKTISVLQKQTSAILKFFFRFRLWLRHCNPHETLHKIAKLHLYRNTYCGNMTSQRFFKMAAAAAQYYFRFPICDATVFGRSKYISKPNFVDMSQFTAEI